MDHSKVFKHSKYCTNCPQAQWSTREAPLCPFNLPCPKKAWKSGPTAYKHAGIDGRGKKMGSYWALQTIFPMSTHKIKLQCNTIWLFTLYNSAHCTQIALDLQSDDEYQSLMKIFRLGFRLQQLLTCSQLSTVQRQLKQKCRLHPLWETPIQWSR